MRLIEERIKELERECWDHQTNHLNAETFAKLMVKEVLSAQEKLIANGHNAWHLHSPTLEYFGIKQ